MATRLFTDREVAAVLGVSRRQIWKLQTTGKMPEPVRIGRSVRWRSDDIENWISAGCPGGQALERLCANGRAGGEGRR